MPRWLFLVVSLLLAGCASAPAHVSSSQSLSPGAAPSQAASVPARTVTKETNATFVGYVGTKGTLPGDEMAISETGPVGTTYDRRLLSLEVTMDAGTSGPQQWEVCVRHEAEALACKQGTSPLALHLDGTAMDLPDGEYQWEVRAAGPAPPAAAAAAVTLAITVRGVMAA